MDIENGWVTCNLGFRQGRELVLDNYQPYPSQYKAGLYMFPVPLSVEEIRLISKKDMLDKR